MAFTNRIQWQNLQKFNGLSLTTSYQILQASFDFPVYILKMLNNSNTLVYISTDGINDMDVLPANSYSVYDEYKGTQREFISKGGTLYIRRDIDSPESAGYIYVVTQYLVTN